MHGRADARTRQTGRGSVGQTGGMSQPMSNPGRLPSIPTLPRGVEIAAFGDYAGAQKAVDHLSDKAFTVQHLTIVGEDLRMVERVTGRLTWGRVGVAGVAGGAWFGLFVGLALSLLGGVDSGGSVLAAIAMGAGFGAMFSLISYSFSRGKRDFTSSSQIVAARYVVLCQPEHAGEARRILDEAGLRSTAGPQAPRPPAGPGTAVPSPAPTAPTDPARAQGEDSAPSAPRSQYLTADGRPRYGVRAEPAPDPDQTDQT